MLAAQAFRFYGLGSLLSPFKPKRAPFLFLRLMDKILHDLKDSKLWELWYIPYNG